MDIDWATIRDEFPGLHGTMRGKPLVYLDSAATAQKHASVIERMTRFMREEYATVHRSLYQRSAEATQLYEDARSAAAQFLGAPAPETIVFTMGCTDALNLVAWSWGRANLGRGDQVLLTAMEHHSNIVPWQLVCEQTGAELVVCPMHDDGSLDMEAYRRLLASGRVKLVAMIHVANSLGTVNPVRACAAEAHASGARFLLDGAQSTPHRPVDVQDLDCDFFVCAPHKFYGPTGIGLLYGKREVLEAMPPWRGGGEMIESVTFEKTTFAAPPSRFEAGTPPIVEVVGLGQACRWLMDVGMEAVAARERQLFAYAETQLATVPGLRRIGTAPERSTVLSFIMDQAHPADIGTVLDGEGVAVRAGHHCAQPVMRRFAIPATARISLGIYSNEADIDRAVAALHLVAELFS